MKIIGLIPARGGSKGIPKKNIKELAGKPLLQYTSEAALKSKKLSGILLTTDDEEIAALGKKLGLQVPFIRPANLAADLSPTLPAIQHALNYILSNGIACDAVCLLQPTTPFRTTDDIDAALEIFEKGQMDSLISVRPVPHEFNPHWIFEVDKDTNYLKIATGEKEIIPRRQDLPQGYYRDGSIYITKTDVVLKQNSLYGKSIGYYLSTNKTHVNIDTMEDWAKAEVFLSQKN